MRKRSLENLLASVDDVENAVSSSPSVSLFSSFSHVPPPFPSKTNRSSSADLYKKFDELLDATTFAPQSGDKITGTVSR